MTVYLAAAAVLCLLLPSVQAADLTTTATDTGNNGTNSSRCQLAPVDGDLHLHLVDVAASGTKLLKYSLSVVGYDENPLSGNMQHHYQADRWHRVFTRHGRVLLSLSFNYDMLSLTLLQIGVEKMDVELKDMPAGCLGELNEEDKVALVRDLIMRDFVAGEDDLWLDDHNYVCHQVLVPQAGKAGHVRFADECCTRTEIHKKLTCQNEEEIFTLTILYYLLIIIKVAFLLFGPLYLQKWMFTDSVTTKTYLVSMTEPVTQNLTSRQVKRYGAPTAPVASIEDGKSGKFEFNVLHVLVDHNRLMTERKVPIGFFKFIGDTFLRCKISYYEPFASCCSESIFGSWTRWFLCLPLFKNETACNIKWKVMCSWRIFFMFIGACLMFVLVSLPFILRIVIFYVWEEPEILQQKQKIQEMNMTEIVDHTVFQDLTPTHWFLIMVYVFYALTFILLSIFRKVFKEEFDDVAKPAMDDLRKVSYVEAIRTVIAHLVLPFEKFGVFGVVVCVVYLPFALCFCLIVLVCYCIPTVYMTGRFIIHHRPGFLSKHIKKQVPESLFEASHNKCLHSLSKGADTMDTMLLLESISHDELKTAQQNLAKQRQLPKNFELDNKMRVSKRERVRSRCPKLVMFLIGVVCIINMFTLLLMYAEVLGFLAEILVLTLMGAIVNASTAHKYVMLAFWCTMYATSCFNKVYEAYFKVNRKIFSFVKDKLGGKVLKYMILDEDEQRDNAFKFFTREELQRLDQERIAITAAHVDNTPSCSETSCEEDEQDEKLIRDKHGLLHWRTHSLVLFVDRYDVPRIPKKLFYQISQQKVIGCPGPEYKCWITAVKNLLNMVFFLLFVFIVILTFGDIYNLSNTNQLLLTAVGGFIPDIIRRVLQPKVDLDVDLNTYTFQGKILDLLSTYTERWPVAQLQWANQLEQEEEVGDKATGGDREEAERDLHYRGGTNA